MSRIERTITRESGERVKIVAFASINGFNPIIYDYDLYMRSKADGAWEGIFYKDYHKYVTPSEIHSVKLELWESLKPKE